MPQSSRRQGLRIVDNFIEATGKVGFSVHGLKVQHYIVIARKKRDEDLGKRLREAVQPEGAAKPIGSTVKRDDIVPRLSRREVFQRRSYRVRSEP